MSDDGKTLTQDIQDRIRDLAYLMWESAGKQQNMALQYWLNAEREILMSVQAATQLMLTTGTQRQKAAQNPAQPAMPAPVNSNEASIEAGQDEVAATPAIVKEPAESEPESRQPIDPTDQGPAEAAASAPSEIPGRKPARAKPGGRRKTTR